MYGQRQVVTWTPGSETCVVVVGDLRGGPWSGALDGRSLCHMSTLRHT